MSDSIFKEENAENRERTKVQFIGKKLQSYSLNENDISRITALLDSSAIDISDDKTTREDAESVYRQIGTVTNTQTGDNVQFVRTSFEKIERHKDYDPRLIGELERLFAKSTFLFDEEADFDTPRADGTLHKKKSNASSFSNYGIKISLDGEEYFVRYTTQNIKNRNDKITGRQFHSQQMSTTKTSNLPMTSSSFMRAGRSVASDYKLASLFGTVDFFAAQEKTALDSLKSHPQENVEDMATSGESFKESGDEECIEKVKRIAFKSTVTLKENAVKAYDPVMGLDDPANETKRCATMATYKESGRVSEKEGDGDIRFWNYEDSIIDLTGTFFLVKSGDVTSDDVKGHIKWLGGRVFETETGDLQIQITDENKDHVIKSNIPLAGNRKVKHDAALMNIGRIINHAKKIERDGTVDLSYNSRKQTLKHKLQVAEYVYFETSVSINGSFFVVELAAEKRKGQDENLLDLYNVKIEKKDSAGTQSVSQTGDNNRMSSIVPPVKLPADVNCSSFDDHLLERKWHQILSENPGKWTGDSAVIDEYREQRALYNGRSDFFRFDPDCLTVYTTETEPAYDNGSASCFTCDCCISVGYVVPDFSGTTDDISVLNGESIIVSIFHEDEKRNSAGINLISPAYGKLYNSGIEKCFSEYVVGTGQLQRDGTLHRGLVRKNERCNFYTFATDSSVKEWMPTRDGWKTRSCNRVCTRYDHRAFFVNILNQQHTAFILKRILSDRTLIRRGCRSYGGF